MYYGILKCLIFCSGGDHSQLQDNLGEPGDSVKPGEPRELDVLLELGESRELGRTR